MTAVLLEHFEAPDNAVILVRDPEGELESDRVREEFVTMLRARFPESFVVILGTISLEEMTVEDLDHILEKLRKHRKTLEK